MKILTVNNKTEEKFLRTKTADFDFGPIADKRELNADKRKNSNQTLDKKELNDLIKQMKETMIQANGIGLSANQVGLNLKFFIAQVPQIENNKIISKKSYAIFNPEIIKVSKQTDLIEEGCLSVPGIQGNVERPQKITVAGFDKNGRRIKIKAKGLTARVFQHEIDHLNGILFIDKTNK